MLKNLFSSDVITPAIKQLAITILLIVLALAGYHLWNQSYGAQRIGTVDLGAVVAAKQKEFTALVSKPGVTDEDRKKSYDMIKAFGADLSAAVKALPDECGCMVLNAAAVIGGGKTEDLTPRIMKKLGL